MPTSSFNTYSVLATVERTWKGPAIKIGPGGLIMWMRRAILAGVLLAAGGAAVAPAQAQDTSVLYGDTLLSVGTGIAILSLPDVQFVKLVPNEFAGATVVGRFSTSANLAGTVGWNINGAITKAISGSRDITLSGNWALIRDNDNTTCTSVTGALCEVNALVPNPATLSFNAVSVGGSLLNSSQRDVTQAGVAVEVKQWLARSMADAPASHAQYVALGADWRAIYQDLKLHTGVSYISSYDLNYSENLDTNYYGAFVAYGGDFTPPLLAEHWRRWGFQSSFRLQGGLYYVDSHYSGSLREPGFFPAVMDSDASASRGDVAFIGGATLETSKHITARSTLSLENRLEYYSFVPSMNYNDNINGGWLSGPNVGTSIGSADAWAYRATLRFTIALGPDGMFAGN
jgi:hypothetical protein